MSVTVSDLFARAWTNRQHFNGKGDGLPGERVVQVNVDKLVPDFEYRHRAPP